MPTTMTFQGALDAVESLPVEQQEDLLGVVHRRLVENRREALTRVVKEARADYQHGKTRKGSVDDLLKDLRV